jgi:hypothetical protein
MEEEQIEFQKIRASFAPMGSLRRVIDAPISIEAAKVLHVVATFVGAGRTIGNVIALSNSGGQIVNCNASNNSFTSSNNITSGSASDYFIDATASNFSLNASSSARDAGLTSASHSPAPPLTSELANMEATRHVLQEKAPRELALDFGKR